MQWGAPCEPSDLVHFRHRIGEAGMQMILAVSIGIHGPQGGEKEVLIDSTVQEKNVTYPTDTKLSETSLNLNCSALDLYRKVLFQKRTD